MNPSSPTETESSLRITVEPPVTALPPNQRVMTPRELEHHQIVEETQQTVRPEQMEEPSIIDVILAFITFGLVFRQKTVWISRRSSTAQGWARPFVAVYHFFYPAFEALWSFCVFFVLVSLAILGRSIGRLDGLPKWVADLSQRRAERRARTGDIMQYDQAFRAKFPSGSVLVLSGQSKTCFQISKAVLKKRAPDLLRRCREIRLMLLPYPRLVRVVRLDSSAQGVRNFLSYLSRDNNNPAATTWWTGGDDPTDDDITELYLMAREYKEPNSYDGGFAQVSRVIPWMRESPLEVFTLACRSRNIDWSLAERAILRFGDRVDADEGPIHAELDANNWLIHEISANNLELLGLATNMHSEYLEAYRFSHDYVWEVLQQTLLAHGQHNVATFLEGKMRTVLVVLADGFLRRAGNRRCAEADVDEVSSARELFVCEHA